MTASGREIGAAAVDLLAEAGVRRFYTVPGESFMPLLTAVEADPRLTLVSTRHESGAAFMAEADAKLTGRPAVAMATRGVGAANLAIGVHTAYQDSTPLIVLLGQVDSDHLHKGAFQEVDLTAFFTPVAKWAVTAHRADRICDLIGRAYEIAVSGRPGPVVIALPSDLLTERTDLPTPPIHQASGSAGRPAVAQADLSVLAERLLAARAPVLIAGSGARGDSKALRAVAEGFGCGVYTGFRRQDLFPNDHPLYLGHLGLGGGPTLDALRAADLVVLAGSRLDEITSQGYTLPAPGTDVVQIDIAPQPLGTGTPPVQRLTADVTGALAALADRAPGRPPARDWEAAHQRHLDGTRAPEAVDPSAGLDPARIVTAIQRSLPADTVVTNDAGNFAAFVQRHWNFTRPHTQLGPINGAMGYAVPAGVAAALAEPHRHVLATVGDGGFLMTGPEVETAVRLGLSLTVAVFRNGLYGTIAMHQARAYGQLAAVDIGPVDIAAVARGLGATGVTIRTEEQLESALTEITTGPPTVTVLDILTDPDLIAPGKRLSVELRAS
ncbi:acetolactate synthase-1/2/3 large subunit [Spinactinospora alkalitolerans]|uniref:Acetolactate synthase-1/2/3 large subunit n=1 Tax=Spinactinospora alkalitolerans TaxID=687207 RepID=A0A852TXK1_9ACTN|nr:thiamine pyrophosphate-binding protein [Spinactinospora alkalitolerans]NYE48481.1 acetolactate synthase-1/2/3 large subunit [Spinactinospora alkalitolerans]